MSRVFDNQQKTLSHTHRLLHLWITLLVVLMIVSTYLALTHFNQGKSARAAASSFSFTAVGDYAQSNYTTANLDYIAKSGASFNLALGDLNYDPTHITAAAWSAYVQSHLPANFPFEIVAGEHDY